MARNPNVAKMNRQRFTRRRGNFRPFSDPTTNDQTHINPELRKFWSDRVSTGSSVDRSAIPDGSRPYFDYKGHVAYRPPHKLDDSTPKSIYHLHTWFPGARFVSLERKAVLDQMRALMLDTEPEFNIILTRTRFAILRLYFTPKQECWWFVYQECNTVKASITYGDKKRALAVWRTDTIHWKVERVFSPIVDANGRLDSS